MTPADPLIVLRRAIDVYQRLTDAGIECSIGGALALAYHVDSPRATGDIDVNISLSADRAHEALARLPDDVPWDDHVLAQILRDEQVRIMWPVPGESLPMPLDLFFMADELHDVARSRAELVPMLDTEIKVLSATDLTIFKALFGRSKDWADIEQMVNASNSTVDLDEAIGWVAAIVGAEDGRVERLRSLTG